MLGICMLVTKIKKNKLINVISIKLLVNSKLL